MPYMIQKCEGQEAKTKAAERPPLGPGVEDPRIASLEMWGSSFTDPGEDWCEFRLYDANGIELGKRRLRGY